jgi:LysM repeat protein
MAPIVLLAAIAAVGYVVSSALREDEQGSSSRSRDAGGAKTSTGRKTSTGARTTTTSSQPRTYTVKSGDTLGTIAEQTGVSVAELQELNPDLDPQSLTVGDRIRLRR